MRALFKIPISLGDFIYKIGEHDVPKAHACGWYFEALVKDGGIVLLDAQEEPEDLSSKRGRPPKTEQN